MSDQHSPSSSERSETRRPDHVPGTVGVLGGGRMGAGIAHAFLLAGSRVTVVERDVASADAALQRIRESIRRSVERDSAADETELASRITTGTDIAAFAAVDLVIEAVPEDRALKDDALARAEAAMPEHATLASNTSSISIDDLAAGRLRPERFLGLHFFNPVPASALVEIVRGAATGTAVVESAKLWIESLGKTPIVVRDSPGSHRLDSA